MMTWRRITRVRLPTVTVTLPKLRISTGRISPRLPWQCALPPETSPTPSDTGKARQISKISSIQIGFEDFEANADFTTRPGRNTFGVGIANKEIRVNGEKYTVIAVGLRGCGYYAEWAGDLNVGLDGEHTGFAICREKGACVSSDLPCKAQRDKRQDQALVHRLQPRSGRGQTLLGGALDDMYLSGASVGKNVTLSPKDMYIYTFEAPMGADASKVGGRIYENIHNVINYNDLVVRVAPECMGFARYGVDHVMPSGQSSTQTIRSSRRACSRCSRPLKTPANTASTTSNMSPLPPARLPTRSSPASAAML